MAISLALTDCNAFSMRGPPLNPGVWPMSPYCQVQSIGQQVVDVASPAKHLADDDLDVLVVDVDAL